MTSKSNSNQHQEQEQLQMQSLSPQQIMVIKLLELPVVEFEERVKGEILDNPALDEGKESQENTDVSDTYETDNEDRYNHEDLSLGDYLSEDDIPD